MVNPTTEENAAASSSNAAAIDALSVKSRLPAFWRDDPSLWFNQVETILASQKLGDEQNFCLIVAQLEKTEIEQIRDILASPPNGTRYQQAKKRLVAAYEETETKKLHRLFNDVELGDQRPSQLLRQMKSLAGANIPQGTLRMLWLGHLPSSTRAVLAVSKGDDLEDLAILADKVHEQTNEVNSLCDCRTKSAAATQREAENDVDNLKRTVEELTEEVAALRMQRSRPWNRRHPASTNPRYRQTERQTQDQASNIICYFHRRFGTQARRCRFPCNFNKNQGN